MENPLTNIAEIIERITTGKLSRIKIGPRYARTVLRYIDMADDLFSPEQETEAREWVREQLLTSVRSHDIKWLPNWLETPIEDLVVNIVIDLGWELLHSQRLRASLSAPVAVK